MKKILFIAGILSITAIMAFLVIKEKPRGLGFAYYHEVTYSTHHNVWVIGEETTKPDTAEVFIAGIDIYKQKQGTIGVYHLTNTTIYYDEYRGYIARV